MPKWLRSNPVLIIEGLTFLSGMMVWISTMITTPKELEDFKILHNAQMTEVNRKIELLEQRIHLLEVSLEKSNTKVDLILTGVYDLRNDIKQHHSK